MSLGSQSVPSSCSGDDNSDKTQAIPSALIKEQWQLVLGQDCTISELNNAITQCEQLVLSSEEYSEERKWLVRHLVELRFRAKELEDLATDPNLGRSAKVVLGHHFVPTVGRNLPTSTQRCDNCCGTIWSVVHASYTCRDCSFLVHHKCIDNIIRVCAHVIASERKDPIADICPEIGLLAQKCKCAECKMQFKFKRSLVEPRLCDYSGLYYCSTCHWNDQSVIPSRIVHNWDFSMRKVCRASLQEINLCLDKPIINLENSNSKLFIFLDKLNSIKKVRQSLVYMRKYLLECRIATELKLIDVNVGTRRYLIQSPDMYSITDLRQVESGAMSEFLNKLCEIFEKHIRNCAICSGKGYLCELCSNVEIIYPFDDGCISCENCSTILHRVCFIRKGICCRCVRLENRRLQLKQEESNDWQAN